MILVDLYQLYQANKFSYLSPEKYIEKYRDELSKIQIGCSFNPEHWIFENQTKSTILKAARFIVEELNMKEIRLSIRWSEVYENGRINIDYYEDLFDYFLDQDVNICLNIGPIKTMRWPEENVPAEILSKLKTIPSKQSIITSFSELGELSLSYLQELLELLKKNFSKRQLSKIKNIQSNNEAFYQFGQYEWTMAEEFEIKVLNLALKHFTKSKIMINSAGKTNLKDVMKFINELEESSGDLRGNFVLGYNYYFKVPGQTKFPLLGAFDNLITFNPFSFSMSTFKKICKEKNIEIEVSELQGEPWVGLDEPGNSERDFQFSLIRSFKEILNLNEDYKSIIRYWGIEDLLVKKFNDETTPEHEKIFEMIKKINTF